MKWMYSKTIIVLNSRYWKTTQTILKRESIKKIMKTITFKYYNFRSPFFFFCSPLFWRLKWSSEVYQPGIPELYLAVAIDFVAAISKPSDDKEERGTEGLTNVRETGGGSRKRSLKNVFHRQSVNRILRGRRAVRSLPLGSMIIL